MKPMKIPAEFLLCRCIAAMGLIAMLGACAVIAPKKAERSGASVHALNYSAREIEFIGVEAPDNPKNEGGGDALNPFGTGGSNCCFSIPDTWRPDLKVIVEYKIYPEPKYRRELVGVPAYPEGKPGDIWLIVHADESAEAVVSKYGPSRPEWPGKVKGYPVPSREYRLKLWGEELQREKAEFTAMEKALKGDAHDLSPEKLARLKQAIEFTREEIIRLEGSKP